MKPNVLLSALLSILLSVVFGSCSKEYSSPLKGQSVEDMKFYSQQSSDRVTIGNLDLTGFSAYSSDYWCSATVFGSYLEVTVTKNTTEQQRQTTVTVTDPEDGTTLTFKVFQAPSGEIILNIKTYKVPENGGEVTINVKSNVKYNVEIPSDIDWIKLTSSSTRGLEPSKVVLNVSKNETGKERSAKITLSNTETNTIEAVTIIQEITPYVDVDKEDIYVDPDGGEFELTAKSNILFNVECKSNWASIIEETEIDEYNYHYKIKVSPTAENKKRINYIYFRNRTNRDLMFVVTIEQEGYLYMLTKDFNLNIGESYAIRYKNNTGHNVNWKSSDTSVAKVDGDGNVKAIAKGNATITVSSSDGKYSDYVSVKVLSGDIEDYLTHTWTMSYVQIGGWIQASIGCTLKNNSNYDIELTKLTTYKDGAYYSSTTDSSLLGILPSNGSKGVTINNVTNFSKIRFSWEYKYNGKIYTYDCDYSY